ncbi:T-complex protein 11-like protein 1 [Tetranychus urticae]|uniref:UBA domain-containing protein n=1 Tax=Tetranychus urticae TaxID=32264 RepID=T1KRM8_TETUR|nr:T-complex protein 11-like protein 1 [Tetranychus urticae]
MSLPGSTSMSFEEKQAAIEQFCNFTGEAENRAKVTLEACNWNVELAVNMHVDGIDNSEPVDVTPTTESSNDAITGSSSGRIIDLTRFIDSSLGASSTSTSSNAIGTSEISTASTSLSNDEEQCNTAKQSTIADESSNHRTLNDTQKVFENSRNSQSEARRTNDVESSSNPNQSKRRSLEDLMRPPLNSMSREAVDQLEFDDNIQARGSKRTVSTSSLPSASNSANISTSPPRFMALEEIMKAANEVYNMCLAHEIAMDKEFKLEKTETPPNSLHKRVDDMMKKVFWELLQNELDESPPNYKRALMLLGEIKESLMSFLLPQHTRLKQEIEEILDLDLVKQQAENGALDFQRYAHYILSVMARLCAPIRDEKIRQLTQTREVVPLFRGIMELLGEMRLDMANFLVQQIRPQILQQSVTYERKKFTEFLENQAKLGKSDGLEYTKKWLKRNYEEHDFSGESTKEIINKVLTSSYVQLLVWDESLQEMFPETLLLDEKRIIALRDFLNLNIYVGSALLVTVAAFPSVQSLSDLKELIRDHLLVILDEKDDKLSDLETRLEGAALQIITDLKKYTDDHVFPEIDSVKEASLKAQIVDLKNENNRIRQIVQRRILEFVESVFTSNTASPVQMPKGLTALQRSLSSIAGQFMRIASHNRAVYGSYYANIITDLVNNKL